MSKEVKKVSDSWVGVWAVTADTGTQGTVEFICCF